MAIARVSYSSQASTGSSATRTITAPSGIVAGNLLLAIFSSHNVSTISTRPTGWAAVTGSPFNQAGDQSVFVEWKVAAVGDVGAANFTWTLGTAGAGVSGIIQYSGTDGTIHKQAGQETANGTSHATPSVTTTVNGCVIISAFAHDEANPGSTWTGGGDTELWDLVETNFYEGTAVYESAQATAGSVSKTATSSLTDPAVTVIVALAPSGAAAYTLTAAQGSFSLSGQSANLLAGRTLTAAQGGFALTGQAAGLLRGFVLAAGQGSFTLSGQNAGLIAARLLTASQGAFSLTGYDASLIYSGSDYVLVANVGNFALTGQAAGLLRGFVLAAGQGSFTLSGQNAGLIAGRLLTASQGAFSLTGYDASLIYSGSDYVLVANVGNFALTGQGANLVAARVLTAVQGSFSLTGQGAGLLAGRSLGAGQGSFALSGQAVVLLAARVLTAVQGNFALSGQAANFIYSGTETPANRIFFVPVEGRIFVIAAASRVYDVPVQSRISEA